MSLLIGFGLVLAAAFVYTWAAIIDLTAKVKRLTNQVDAEQILNTQLQNELNRQDRILGIVCQSLLHNNILTSDIDEASKR